MTAVAVVGGGLAGLVAARRLAVAGADVTLFERESTVGGRVRTTHADGFTFDRGFQVLFPAYPAVQSELDLEALSLGTFRPGATLARPGERSVLADPLRDPRALVPTLLNHNVTLGDAVRVLRLRRELGRTPVSELFDHDDQTIADYLAERGFSKQFRDRFFAPFYGGITLDRSLSSSRSVFEYTFKMLLDCEAALPADGMGAISDQLAAHARDAGATIETDSTVTDVRADDGQASVETKSETVRVDAVVVATDPRSARELTGVESIPTEGRACVTQHFSLPRSQQLDTGDRLVLNADDERPNQVAPMTDAAPSYAPDRYHLLSATFLGEQGADDETLAEEVRDALAAWYPENSFADLELLRTDRIEFAQFAQPPGFCNSTPAVDAPDGPVYLAGDYTAWSSIQGAMQSGIRAASLVRDATDDL
jgi:phytoene dehydrogenase-like protein